MFLFDVVGGPYDIEYVNPYGDGSIDWVVNLFYNITEQGINYVTLFRYNISAESIVPIALNNSDTPIPWPGNRTSPPTGEPLCGWDGCPNFSTVIYSLYFITVFKILQ